MGRVRVRTALGPGLAGVALLAAMMSCRVVSTLGQSNNMSFIPLVSILMNCGASVKEKDEQGRQWFGDEGSKYAPPLANFPSETASSQDLGLPSPVPYMTARILSSAATYSFPVSAGRYFLRLYFYPSAYGTYSRSDAVFGVVANSFTLLHNFSTAQTADALTLSFVMREFSIKVTGDHLNVTFTPEKSRPKAYAFVNGIEIVSMPDLYKEGNLVGFDNVFTITDSVALQTMYRLNVGGQSITAVKDSNLSRTWYDDSPYIYGAADGVTNVNESSQVKYTSSDPAYFAPPDVYASFRSMTPDFRVNGNFNLTWMFMVDANFTYYVRLHFCEWIYTKQNQRVFNIYINNVTAQSDYDVIGSGVDRGTATYMDFTISMYAQAGDSFLFLALGPSVDLNPPPEFYDALLNGVEVFKLNDSAGNLAGPNPVKVPDFNYTAPIANGNGPSLGSQSSNKAPVIGGVAGGVAVFGLILALCCFVRKRRSGTSDTDKPSGWLPLPLYGGNSHTMGSKISTASGKSGTGSYVSSAPSSFCRHFTFAEIQEATKNFDESRLLGVGGFGKVYEGEIDGGVMVAVKRGNPLAEQGVHEFQTEIEMLSKLRHRHLVSLIGYCEENCEMILVYDYMAKGPLRGHLYGNTNPIPLSWKQRLEICIGAARGLHYLHTGAAQTIIHRDVKTTNILLDENLVAKVSDFGLSKTGPTLDHTHVSTVVKGSFGYLDPEYYRRQQLTEKSDVYSFGVVLFEVLCARPAINPSLPRDQVSIAEWALHHQRKGILEQIIDPHLKGKINPESLKKFGEAAEKCLAEQGVERPAMGDVLWNLEFALQLQETAMENKLIDDTTNNFVQMSPDYHHSNNPVDINTSTSAVARSMASVDLDDVPPSAVFSQLVNPQGR